MTKNFLLLTIVGIFLISCKSDKKNLVKENKNTKENWIQLFNGKDLNDWIVKINGYPVGENIHNTFRVKDSVLKVSYEGYEDFGQSYGHIFYKNPFSSYRLKLQYRFVGEQAPGGQPWAKKNSGVMLHSQSPKSMGVDQGFPISLEAQFLGGVESGVERPTGNLCTPGTHVEMNGNLITDHCINSTSETYYGEEWIDVDILVLKDSIITHSINGKEVIKYYNAVYGGEYTPDIETWKAKEKTPLKEGYISLQSESHPIEFRNIELLNLDD